MEQILINKYINQSVHYVNFFSVTLFYWLRSTALYAELSYNTTGQFRLFLDWNQSFCWTWCSFSVLMQSDYLKKPYVKYYKKTMSFHFVIRCNFLKINHCMYNFIFLMSLQELDLIMWLCLLFAKDQTIGKKFLLRRGHYLFESF